MNGIYEFSIIKESWLKEKFSLKKGIYISIDGKNIKGSGNAEREISPIHLLHAYNQLGIVIGQKECMSEKQNEITACPELLDILKIKDAVITTGAMMCQKTVYEKIIRKSCDLCPYSQEQPSDDAVGNRGVFSMEDSRTRQIFQTSSKVHGRTEKRIYCLDTDISWFSEKEKWKELKAFGKCSFISQEKEKRLLRQDISSAQLMMS